MHVHGRYSHHAMIQTRPLRDTVVRLSSSWDTFPTFRAVIFWIVNNVSLAISGSVTLKAGASGRTHMAHDGISNTVPNYASRWHALAC